MNIAVIFAGGIGSRMKNKDGIPKQFLEIDGVPILVWTLRNFQDNSEIDAIVVVMLEKYIEITREMMDSFGLSKVKKIVAGGDTGQKSIYAGLRAAKELADQDDTIVLIHDGVRPFIEPDLIARNISAVKEYGSAISCVPSKETVVKLDSEMNLENIIDRSTVWLARAPQSFYLKDILRAHEDALRRGEDNVIDSCTMMMKEGIKLHSVETCSENIKITTPEDYYVAQGLIMKRKGEDE